MSDHQEDITFMTMYEPQMEKAMAPTPVLLPGKSHGWIPPGSSVHRILHARVLKWVAISFSKGSS